MEQIRVVVADDSATMRQLVTASLATDPNIRVVGQAADAAEARALIKAHNPDVLTLDVEMPGMDGIDFLEKIMQLRPMPVIMVSTLTANGSDTAIRALEIGAVDCVPKPSPDAPNSFRDLPERVRAAAHSRVKRESTAIATTATKPPTTSFEPNDAIVAIGSSTGGVEALISVVSEFPKTCAPTVITQHMPPHFTKSLAARLNRLGGPLVSEATDGSPLRPGHVYLAPGGGKHLKIVRGDVPRCKLVETDLVNGHRPSVDVLFGSVADVAGSKAVAAILTGLGRDGADGMLRIKQAGGMTFGQNEATCVVYGMPKAAKSIGAVAHELALSEIGSKIVKHTAKKTGSN